MHDRDGAPELGIAAVRTDDGARAWGLSREAATLAAMEADEFVGQQAEISSDGALTF